MRTFGRVLALLFCIGMFIRFVASVLAVVMTLDRPNAASYHIGHAVVPLLLFIVGVWAFRALGAKRESVES